MRSMRMDWRRVRVFLSICGAAVGAMICQVQHHFVLSLSAPHGLRVMTTHKCGLVLLAAAGWMVVECSWVARAGLPQRLKPLESY